MKLRSRLRIVREIARDLLGLKPGDALLGIRDETLFFSEGWGDLEKIERLRSSRLLEEDPKPLDVTRDEIRQEPDGSTRKFASFRSPMPEEFLPEVARTARVQLLLPKGYTTETPIVIVFPMTGDEGYEFREGRVCQPMLRRGIGTLVLEGPFYGVRRPTYQKNYFFNTVHDLMAMSIAASLEGRAMLTELRARGFTKLGVAGQSQGGMVASVVASLTPFPVFAAISLAAHSPEVILSQGLLRSFVNWSALDLPSMEEAQSRLRELLKVGDVLLRPPPVAPQCAFLQAGRGDLISPTWSVRKIHDHWKGSTLEWLYATHATTLSWHCHRFVRLVAHAAASELPSQV